METFTLDTSGDIFIPDPRFPDASTRIRWSDLDPFTQGYIERLFASVRVPDRANLKHHGLYMHDGHGSVRAVAFSDLARETLARIIEDCAAADHLRPGVTSEGDRLAGRELWALRQTGKIDRFPPLTPNLGDGSKVYLREPV